MGDAGLTFSFLWEGPISLEQAGTMPMACALAVRDFLIRLGVPSRCKWPNDIIAEAGKICGILTESVAGPDGTVRLVMGIGINVNSDPDRDAKIDQPAAWLSAYAPSASAPRTLLPKVLTCLEKRINTWTSRGYPGIKRDLEGCLWGIGKPVSVRHDGRLVKGVIEGLGDKGELRLRDEAGRSIHVVSAAALDY